MVQFTTEYSYKFDLNNKTLIIESIQIASDGFLVAIGSGLIVEAIKNLILYVLSGKATILSYEEYKRELNEKVIGDKFIRERQYVRELIDILDSCFSKLKNCNNEVSGYIRNEINFLVSKIEKLQGATRFDMLL